MMDDYHPAFDDSEPASKSHSDMDHIRIGPSPYMLWGDFAMHPLFLLGVAALGFCYSAELRRFLWELSSSRGYRSFIIDCFDWLVAHPFVPLLAIAAAFAHVFIRYSTTFYEISSDYLTIRIGFLSRKSPVGPFMTFNDPIAFSTVTDANAPRGIFSHLTGAGTLEIHTTDEKTKQITMRWVPKVRDTQRAILDRAGVKKARMLSTV